MEGENNQKKDLTNSLKTDILQVGKVRELRGKEKKMSYKMFLDDYRNPSTPDFVVVRSYEEAVKKVASSGAPSFVAFDHNLGGEKTGYDFAKWLTDKDMAEGGRFLPKDFKYSTHSSDMEARKCVDYTLGRYLKKRAKAENLSASK